MTQTELETLASKLNTIDDRSAARALLDGAKLSLADYRTLTAITNVPVRSKATRTDIREVLIHVLVGIRVDGLAIYSRARGY